MTRIATRPGLRIALAALVIAALWAVAVWVAAARSAPGSPAAQLPPRIAGAEQWTAAIGAGQVVDGRMTVARLSDAGEALILWQPEPFAALDRPVLRIAIENFPFNYVLMLAWRVAGDPATAFTRLQVPTGGQQTYLLHRLSEWQGQIEEIALYLHPQAGPALTIQEPIEITSLAFESDNWGARMASLLTSWWAADPWNLKSVNTLGVYPDLVEGARLTPMIFVGFVIGVLVCGLILLPVGLVAWLRLSAGWLLAAALLVNIHWLVGLVTQRQATARVSREAAGAPMSPVFDAALVELVEAAKRHLPPPPQARIFVAADARLFELRAAWHLLPHNVAVRLPKSGGADRPGVRPGDFLLIYRRPDLLRQAHAGRLRLRGGRWRVELLWETADGALLKFVRADR